MTEPVEPKPDDNAASPLPSVSEYLRGEGGLPLDHTLSPGDDLPGPLPSLVPFPVPPDLHRPVESNPHPPFQLPGGDEDEPEGHAPAMHTVEQESPIPKFRDRIRSAMEEREKNRVPLAVEYLKDFRTLAPDVAKAVKSLVDSLVSEGFTHAEAIDLAKLLIDRKLYIL